MRTIQVHPLSASLGAIAVSVVIVLSSQTTAPAQTTWPPPKSMILNVFQEFPNGLQLPPGGSQVVVTVPNDRWLTVTGISALGGSNLSWGELSVTGTTTKRGRANSNIGGGFDLSGGPLLGCPEASPSTCGGPIGWTFAPGSSVVLFNDSLQPGGVGFLAVIGYFSRN